jgi:hypothetical protein
MLIHRRLATAAALAAATLTIGCGGGGGDDSLSRPAPSRSDFPAPGGKTLAQVLAQGSPDGPVVSPSAMTFTTGTNRVAFGVFTTGREAIRGAEVALYAAPGRNGKALGPFPARIEDLTTEPRYRAQTTADDPDAAQVVYATGIPFDRKGEWRVGALIRRGSSFDASLMPSLSVGTNAQVPQVGSRAPMIHTPTGKTAAEIAKIDTRIPHDDMHAVDYADAYGKRPIILLFATPQLCQSRVCGPVVDEQLQVKQAYAGRAEFIHMEVYEDNDPNKPLRPQLAAFHLPSEPWLFAIDRHGIVRARIEGAFGIRTLEKAVKAAITGKSDA